MTPMRRLRRSSSSRDRLGQPHAHRRRRVAPARRRLDRRAPGSSTASRAIRSASARVEVGGSRGRGSGARRGRRRPRRRGRRRPRRTRRRGSTSPATPRPPSTSWQNPCVVAIVAASKSASARPSRPRRCWTSLAASRSRAAGRPRRRSSARAAASDRSSPRSADTRRSRTRSRSSPVAMRVKVTSRRRSSGVPSAT